jgi:hypothetical protein
MLFSGSSNPESIANKHDGIQIVDTKKSPENLVRKEAVSELPNLNRTVMVLNLRDLLSRTTGRVDP